MPDEFEPDESDNLGEPPSFFPYDDEPIEGEPIGDSEPVEVRIEGVFRNDSNGTSSRFVVLSDGERRLPIVIGPFESQAILLPMEQQRPDRPMTHDLIRTIMDRLGGTLDRVVIDDLWNATYYAKLFIRTGREEIQVDARPSDAIALAVRFDASIYVSEAILDAGGDE